MSPSSLLALSAAIIFAIWMYSSLIKGVPINKRIDEHVSIESVKRAQVSGSNCKPKTVFQHIEQGLRINPEGPALICLFQSNSHFSNHGVPASAVRQATNSRGLWQKQLPSLEKGSDGDWNRNMAPSMPSCLTVSYQQLHDIAVRVAAGLFANAATPGTKMVMLIPNGGEYALLLYACVLLRITYVCLDPSMLEISGFTMLKHLLRTLKPQIVVAPDSMSGRALDVAVAELQLARPICISLSSTVDSNWISLASLIAEGKAALKKKLVDQDTLVEAARMDQGSRVHSIMFTSGTSGLPKGCPLRVDGMSYALESQAWLLEDDTDENSTNHQVRALMQPHNSRGIAPAQTLQTWRAGGTVVLTGQSFDIKGALDAIDRVRVTFIVLTPPMVHELADALSSRPDIDVSSVKTIQVGGDTVTKGLIERCQGMFPNACVCVNHGMTEGPGAFMWPRKFSSMSVHQLPLYGEFVCPVGSVAPGAVVRIWDVSQNKGNRICARNELGEMHVSCPSIINHYWGGVSDEAFYVDKDGRRWFKTGDAAIIDTDGLVFVIGRVKDIILRAGVSILPAPIECLVEDCTGSQSVVVAVKHRVLGAEPFAIVQSTNDSTVQQIKERVKVVFGRDSALGGVLTLKQIGFLEFPLNATRKVIKSELQTAVKAYLESAVAK